MKKNIHSFERPNPVWDRLRTVASATFRASFSGLLVTTALTSGALASEEKVTIEASWSAEERRQVLDRTLEVRLAPKLESLSAAERQALDHLLRVGELLHEAYLQSRHSQGLEVHRQLAELESDSESESSELADLFRTFNGPIGTTLDNRREPFVTVGKERPGKNVYPADLSAEALLAFVETHPDQRRNLLDLRHIVRSGSRVQLEEDLARLARHPTLSKLHPGLQTRLESWSKSDEPPAYYALPYSLAYAEWIVPAYEELRAAATVLESEDPDFAAYLANRARDLISDNYESGDASWVTGSFGNLNAQIGSYETYDDQIQGIKSFFSTSLLVKDVERSRQLAKAIGGLQEIENALPYDHQKKVRSDIPVGIYQVVADFGQARGTNTATILPNDPRHTRKYGRTILLRHNIMTHPEIFAEGVARFAAAVVPDQVDDLTLDGNFRRTLWHEVGHYLGVDTDVQGRPISVGQYSNLLEEMKSDLVSLFTAPRLTAAGYYSESELRSIYASGVLRTLQAVKPRPTQPYQSMQLMQMNYFLDQGLLTLDTNQQLTINYERYPAVVETLLEQVLELQYSGDPELAKQFVDRWTTWNEETHGAIAEKIRQAQRYRFRRVRYAALGE